jgi:hypothetical protein
MDTAGPDQMPLTRPFLDTLREMRAGLTMEDLDREFHRLIRSVVATGKAGKLVFTVTVKPAVRGVNPDKVFLIDDVTAKEPKPNRPESLFFVDERGNTSVNDPHQGTLDLKTVGARASLG